MPGCFSPSQPIRSVGKACLRSTLSKSRTCHAVPVAYGALHLYVALGADTPRGSAQRAASTGSLDLHVGLKRRRPPDQQRSHLRKEQLLSSPAKRGWESKRVRGSGTVRRLKVERKGVERRRTPTRAFHLRTSYPFSARPTDPAPPPPDPPASPAGAPAKPQPRPPSPPRDAAADYTSSSSRIRTPR